MFKKKIITRFAPSPTGFMHIGGIRTAIYAWVYAKQNNGTFILRIEDTDKEREIEGSIPHIIESLKWLGIDWDEGPNIGGPHKPYKQSERLSIYKKYADKLLKENNAYPDNYTKQEVEIFRQKAKNENKPFLYRNHRPVSNNLDKNWYKEKPLRFKVNNIKRYKWNDLVFNNLSAGEEALDDFILIKSDGYPTYNFAHIVDDIEMGITHIMRGQEFISSIPKFLSLYEALKVKPPLFVTLPPIMEENGKKKLSKRDGAKDILEYRNEGYLSEAMFNFLILIGWNPGTNQEIIRKKDFIKMFDISKIQHSGGNFNEEKLDWINKEYLKLLSKNEKKEYLKKFIPLNIKNLSGYNDEILSKIIPIIFERISKGKDIITMSQGGDLTYFFEKPIFKKNALIFKPEKINKEEKYKKILNYLTQAIILLKKIKEKDFIRENIKNIVLPYAKEVGTGDLLWPIRYALSGKDKSPDPFVLIEVLGKEETIERLNYAIKLLS